MTDSAPTNNNNEPLAVRLRRESEAVRQRRQAEQDVIFEEAREVLHELFLNAIKTAAGNGQTGIHAARPMDWVCGLELYRAGRISGDMATRLYDDLKAFVQQTPENGFVWKDRMAHTYGCECDAGKPPCTSFVDILMEE